MHSWSLRSIQKLSVWKFCCTLLMMKGQRRLLPKFLCRVLGARELIFPGLHRSLQAVTYLRHLRWNMSRRTIENVLLGNRRHPLLVLAPRRSHRRTVIGRSSTGQSQRPALAPQDGLWVKLFKRSDEGRTCWEQWSFVTAPCKLIRVLQTMRQMFQACRIWQTGLCFWHPLVKLRRQHL